MFVVVVVVVVVVVAVVDAAHEPRAGSTQVFLFSRRHKWFPAAVGNVLEEPGVAYSYGCHWLLVHHHRSELATDH